MMLLCELCFSAGLYLWSVLSKGDTGGLGQELYLAGSVGIFLVWCASRIIGKRVQKLLLPVAVFLNLGLSVAWRTGGKHLEKYLQSLPVMAVAFVVVYLAVRFSKAYQTASAGLFCGAGILILIFGARIMGPQINGSYLYFGRIMIFGGALVLFPFVAAWLLSMQENRYLGGDIRNLSLPLFALLLYCFLLYLGCILCNEFGLLLVLACTTTILFFVRCKNLLTKLFYTLACAGGALLAGLQVDHLWARIRIWMHPARAYGDGVLGERAESVLYLFRNIYKMGWWGRGIGQLSKSYYPTLNTDHVLVLLMNDYSIFLALGVILLGILLIRRMLAGQSQMCTYDKYLNLACSLILAFILLIDTGSNLGSFLTAGIGFPWISEGISVNVMLTCLVAIHCGLTGRKERVYAEAS